MCIFEPLEDPQKRRIHGQMVTDRDLSSPGIRGGHLLHHVHPAAGGQVPRPDLHDDALLAEGVRRDPRGHQEEHRRRRGRHLAGQALHPLGGGVPRRMRQRTHGPGKQSNRKIFFEMSYICHLQVFIFVINLRPKIKE